MTLHDQAVQLYKQLHVDSEDWDVPLIEAALRAVVEEDAKVAASMTDGVHPVLCTNIAAAIRRRLEET